MKYRLCLKICCEMFFPVVETTVIYFKISNVFQENVQTKLGIGDKSTLFVLGMTLFDTTFAVKLQMHLGRKCILLLIILNSGLKNTVRFIG